MVVLVDRLLSLNKHFITGNIWGSVATLMLTPEYHRSAISSEWLWDYNLSYLSQGRFIRMFVRINTLGVFV